MTSTASRPAAQSGVRAPEPPALLPPWHTPPPLPPPAPRGPAGAGPPVRDGGGAAGRRRAGPAEGRDPPAAARPHGRARLVRHHHPRGRRRTRTGRLRVLHGQRGAGP